jgi:hypothetical protein
MDNFSTAKAFEILEAHTPEQWFHKRSDFRRFLPTFSSEPDFADYVNQCFKWQKIADDFADNDDPTSALMAQEEAECETPVPVMIFNYGSNTFNYDNLIAMNSELSSENTKVFITQNSSIKKPGTKKEGLVREWELCLTYKTPDSLFVSLQQTALFYPYEYNLSSYIKKWQNKYKTSVLAANKRFLVLDCQNMHKLEPTFLSELLESDPLEEDTDIEDAFEKWKKVFLTWDD